MEMCGLYRRLDIHWQGQPVSLVVRECQEVHDVVALYDMTVPPPSWWSRLLRRLGLRSPFIDKCQTQYVMGIRWLEGRIISVMPDEWKAGHDAIPIDDPALTTYLRILSDEGDIKSNGRYRLAPEAVKC